jgi:dGTPase
VASDPNKRSTARKGHPAKKRPAVTNERITEATSAPNQSESPFDETRIGDIADLIDLGHLDVMRDFGALREAGAMSRSLDIKAGLQDISQTFSKIVEKIKRSRSRPVSPVSVDDSYELYSARDLHRPADIYRDRPRSQPRVPYGIDTAKEYGRIVHSMAFRRLQGKMQLFPPSESPLLRNRLTHSLEVADIAARIAVSLNMKLFPREYKKEPPRESRKSRIDPSIVTAAALAHDIGHPPFGHTGETILAYLMSKHGSFEGNAQTLRVLTRLEDRLYHGRGSESDQSNAKSCGLNLMFRTIASVIKYDREIPAAARPKPKGNRKATETKISWADIRATKIKKGYYREDIDVVRQVRDHVIRPERGNPPKLKTIECQIMDIADDIAYSTYDLEDCMIANVTHPLDLLSISDDLLNTIAEQTTKSLADYGYNHTITASEIIVTYQKLFEKLILRSDASHYELESSIDLGRYLGWSYMDGRVLAEHALRRRRFTETLIRQAVDAISIKEWRPENPALMELDIDPERLLFIECLKHHNYHKTILSRPLQLYADRAKMILERLWYALLHDEKNHLMPPQKQEFYADHIGDVARDDRETFRYRFICDYIAGLTDAEAVRLYARIASIDDRSIFEPSMLM